jgi:hypothetical protein
MTEKYDMDQFFNWLTKPMTVDEIDAWYRANNIVPEMSDLFRDFCFTLLNLVDTTYLGDDNNSVETKIGLSSEDNELHFKWCWNRVIDNFKKENIIFENDDEMFEYFRNFFMETYYNPEQKTLKNTLNEFFVTIFNRTNRHTKSDIEMFTQLYKMLEKNLNM